MVQKAIEKINVEVQKAPNDVYRAQVGEYIIDHIITGEDAEKIMDEKKSLEKALEEITSKARKQAVANKAVIEDSVVFGWAMNYFGLQDGETTNPQTVAEKPTEKALSLSLDDFF